MLFVLFKHKTAYEMRISDWSSDVCSSDLSADTDSEVAVQVDQAMLATTREPEPSVVSAGRLPGGMKDLFLLDESEESEVYRAIPAWLPDNWQLQGDRRTGPGAFRLAVLWHAALEEAIKAWLQVTGAPGMAFDIGWGFMNEEIGRASCRERVCKYV